MFFVTLALLAHTTFAPVADADQSLISRLHKMLDQRSDKKAWFIKFERELPKSSIPIWKRLQKQSPPKSRTYAETSFAFAYYGVDYDANLRRMLRPYTMWHKSNNSQVQEYFRQYPKNDSNYNDLNHWGNISEALNLLYLKHHDLKSLGAWLDLKLDAHPGEESADELASLWKRHKVDMLHAAYGHPKRIDNLAEALWFEVASGDKQEKALVRDQVREVMRITRLPDRRAAITAKQVAQSIQQQEQQSQREYATKK
jgi:hypothetical protein